MLRNAVLSLFTFFFTFSLLAIVPHNASSYERPEKKPAIVLAAFGTSDPAALQSILNVEKRVQNAFPGHDVYLSFTSNIIRGKWAKLSNNKSFRQAHPQIPGRIYKIKNTLSVLAALQEQGGAGDIMVQSLHITNGSEFSDLKSIVDNLSKITAMQKSLVPFPHLALADSALSEGGKKDIDRAAGALHSVAQAAKEKNAALVLMGHGNEHLPLTIYKKLEKALTERYQLPVFICLVEGKPGFDDALKFLDKGKHKNVYLSPLMLVAGDHAKNDMAGDDEDSLASLLRSKGINVSVNLTGLGSVNEWADIYVEKLKSLSEKKAK